MLTNAALEQWKRQDLWSEADLQALCCGLVPNASRPLDAGLNEAGEAIRRAILAKTLAVASEPSDASAGDRMYGHARFFRPDVATHWAHTRFPPFPYKPSDFGGEDDPLFVGLDPDELPEELVVARQAFRAVQRGWGSGSTFKNNLMEWIKEHCPEIAKSQQAVERIATVANPKKGGGRPK